MEIHRRSRAVARDVREQLTIVGYAPVGLLAIVTEVLFGRLQRALAPRVSSEGRGKGGRAGEEVTEAAAQGVPV